MLESVHQLGFQQQINKEVLALTSHAGKDSNPMGVGGDALFLVELPEAEGSLSLVTTQHKTPEGAGLINSLNNKGIEHSHFHTYLIGKTMHFNNWVAQGMWHPKSAEDKLIHITGSRSLVERYFNQYSRIQPIGSQYVVDSIKSQLHIYT